MKLYHYPAQAKLDRTIPKNKFYAEGKANSKTEQLFVQQVEKILWAYTLSARTIKLQDQADLKEIQIFQIQARTNDFDTSILKFIDKLILSPIIFEIHYEGNVKVIASYKRLNQADKSKAVLNQYYASDWLNADNRHDLPVYLHLADLYEHFIEQLLPVDPIQNAKTQTESTNTERSIDSTTESITLEDKLAKVQQIESLKKQVEKMQIKVKREKQFNRQVELNRQLHKLEAELNKLMST